jgi:hypothetical protein
MTILVHDIAHDIAPTSPGCTRAASRVHVQAAPGSAARAQPRTCAPGPGWFESSWDLLTGLEVRELSIVDLYAGGVEPDPPSAT